MTPTRNEQKRLALAAQAGDGAASDALARAVWNAVKGQARGYAKKFGLDAEDLFAEGISRFPYVLRSYDPVAGSFLNSMLYASGRRMTEWAEREAKQVKRGRGKRPHENTPDERADSVAAGERRRRIESALASLDPSLAAFARRVGGYGEEQAKPRRAAELADLLPSLAHQFDAIVRSELSRLLPEYAHSG